MKQEAIYQMQKTSKKNSRVRLQTGGDSIFVLLAIISVLIFVSALGMVSYFATR